MTHVVGIFLDQPSVLFFRNLHVCVYVCMHVWECLHQSVRHPDLAPILPPNDTLLFVVHSMPTCTCMCALTRKCISFLHTTSHVNLCRGVPVGHFHNPCVTLHPGIFWCWKVTQHSTLIPLVTESYTVHMLNGMVDHCRVWHQTGRLTLTKMQGCKVTQGSWKWPLGQI